MESPLASSCGKLAADPCNSHRKTCHGTVLATASWPTVDYFGNLDHDRLFVVWHIGWLGFWRGSAALPDRPPGHVESNWFHLLFTPVHYVLRTDTALECKAYVCRNFSASVGPGGGFCQSLHGTLPIATWEESQIHVRTSTTGKFMETCFGHVCCPVAWCEHRPLWYVRSGNEIPFRCSGSQADVHTDQFGFPGCGPPEMPMP